MWIKNDDESFLLDTQHISMLQIEECKNKHDEDFRKWRVYAWGRDRVRMGTRDTEEAAKEYRDEILDTIPISVERVSPITFGEIKGWIKNDFVDKTF